MSKEAIAFDRLQEQHRARYRAPLRSRLQVNAAFCGHQALSLVESSMIRLHVAIAAVALLAVNSCRPRAEPRSHTDPLRYAGRWTHGLSSIPDSVLRRLRCDSAALARIADALERPDSASGYYVAPNPAMYFLVQSERAEFLPLFYRHALAYEGNEAYEWAVEGLARFAERPEPAAFLRALGDTAGHPGFRMSVAAALARVNDAAARSVLRDVRRNGFDPGFSRILDSLLVGPALPNNATRPSCRPGRRR